MKSYVGGSLGDPLMSLVAYVTRQKMGGRPPISKLLRRSNPRRDGDVLTLTVDSLVYWGGQAKTQVRNSMWEIDNICDLFELPPVWGEFELRAEERPGVAPV